MANYQNMPMINVALDILKNHAGKMNISDLMQQTLEAKGLEDKDNKYKTQLYLDITTSSLFVYMGDEEWDLKDRQSLDMFDRDGAEFNTAEDEVLEDEDILNFEDEDDEDTSLNYEEDYEDDDEDYSEEDSDDDDLEHDENGEILERYHEDDDFDEDKYNDYMDDFENMYDDN